MFHQHFNTLGSTQIYLKDNLEQLLSNDPDLLVSCSEQTTGIGRKGNSWHTFPNSLAMSFTIKPNFTPTLTPIEIGLIVVSFFEKKFHKKLTLKWPNDILTDDGKKCGGIICQYIDSSTVIAGLGINLGKFDLPADHNFRHGLGSVDPKLELQAFDQETISKEIYQEILNNRLAPEILRKKFNEHCYHIDKDVFVFEDGQDHIGVFKGIGENGEALIEINSKLQKFLSSSLTILD